MRRRKLGAMLSTVAILALCAGAAGVLWLSQSRRASEVVAAQQAQPSLAELPAGIQAQAPAPMGTLRRLSASPPANPPAEPMTSATASVPLGQPTPTPSLLAPARPPIPDCVPLSGESKSLGAEDTLSAALPTPPTGSLSEGTG